MRIAFAGTPEFAATALAHLLSQGFDVALVLTQPDRPAGRGQQLQASAVKRLALAHGLTVAQPQGLKLDGRFAMDAKVAQAALAAAQVDAMVVVAYGLILPPWVLQAPIKGCFNIHGSLLPRWRGAAPIQRAIEAGDPQTGITIIQMDAGLDTGAMLATQAVAIEPHDTASTLHDRLAPVGAQLMADVLRQAAQGGLKPVAQAAEGATYAAKIDKAEAAIDWQSSASNIERRVRAFDPFPGCTFELHGQTTKLWQARVVPSLGAQTPGTVTTTAQTLIVACGVGALEVLALQRPGARRLTTAQYLQGRQPASPPSQSLPF